MAKRAEECEQFDRALALDANSAAALEGLGCLLVDAGRYEAARPLIEHAVQLQARNVGARECLAYLDAGTDKVAATDEKPPSAVARVQALAAILAGDIDTARRLLRGFAGSGVRAGAAVRDLRRRPSAGADDDGNTC